jgi:hypothetical protein
MPCQPSSTPPDRPALLSTLPASNVSRRVALRGLGGAGLGAAEAPSSVVGAWDLTFRRVDSASAPRSERALASFAAGGGIQAILAPTWHAPSGAPRFHGVGLGTWTTGGDSVIVGRYTALIYNETGDCDGKRRVIIRVSPERSGFLIGAYVDRLYDMEGTLIDLVSGSVDGTVPGLPFTDLQG